MSKSKNAINAMIAGLSLAVLSGCASITTGTTQPLAVETRNSSGQEVLSANCRLTNSKGTWFVTTPGSITIHRATKSPLTVNCTKEGMQQTGVTSIKPKSKGMTWGNLLIGGVVGVVTDGITGAAGYYPSPITVIMDAVSSFVAQTADGTTSTPPLQDKSTQEPTPPSTVESPVSAPSEPPGNGPTVDWRNWGSKSDTKP